MENNALATAANTLAITSQLLAIGIEIGIIAGGFYICQKVKAELGKLEEPKTPEQAGFVVYSKPYPPKKTLREKLSKVKDIVKAVLE